MPLLRGDEDVSWRTMALVEFRGVDAEPDPLSPYAPSFRSLVTPDLRYIEYDDDQVELYDVTHDPAEIDNLASQTPSRELRRLETALSALTRCAAASCRSAENAAID